jgi:hypothetical protein
LITLIIAASSSMRAALGVMLFALAYAASAATFGAMSSWMRRNDPVPALLPHVHQLMSEPGDEVALAAAGRVLDQVPAADTLLRHVVQCLPHDVHRVKSREHLHQLLLAGLWMLDLDDPGVVLQDVRQPRGSEDLFPQVTRRRSNGLTGMGDTGLEPVTSSVSCTAHFGPRAASGDGISISVIAHVAIFLPDTDQLCPISDL